MSKPTVMITGAGIGIGEAAALAFGRAGYHVYVTDVLDEEGQETVAAIEAAGGSAEFSHVDVTDSANVDAAVRPPRPPPARSTPSSPTPASPTRCCSRR